MLPHLKRIKSTPQASKPLCLIENPEFRHLHNCSSHSKLPHLDEKFRRLSCPNPCTGFNDLKPDSRADNLRRRNSYPVARPSTLMEKESLQSASSFNENSSISRGLAGGTLHGHSLTMSHVSSLANSKSHPLADSFPDRKLVPAGNDSQKEREIGDLALSQKENYSQQGRTLNNLCSQTNNSSYSSPETNRKNTFDRVRRVSSYGSNKSSLQSITE